MELLSQKNVPKLQTKNRGCSVRGPVLSSHVLLKLLMAGKKHEDIANGPNSGKDIEPHPNSNRSDPSCGWRRLGFHCVPVYKLPLPCTALNQCHNKNSPLCFSLSLCIAFFPSAFCFERWSCDEDLAVYQRRSLMSSVVDGNTTL